jgi:uncharacterized membrane protein
MALEQLKQLNLNEVTKERLDELKNEVLSMNHDEVIEYLEFVIDEYYKVPEEGENSDNIEHFFSMKEFYPFYEEINAHAESISEESEEPKEGEESEV